MYELKIGNSAKIADLEKGHDIQAGYTEQQKHDEILEAERERFDDWAFKKGMVRDFEFFSDELNYYINSDTRLAFEIWLAAVEPHIDTQKTDQSDSET